MPTVEQLERLLRADPADTFVLYALAQEHAKAGRHEEAVAYYDRVLEVDPHYCYAYFHKARSQEARDDAAGAIETLRAGLPAAREAGDAQAVSEIGGYLEALVAGQGA
ncbi:MAG: tetratricopeptide repeat protein [Phycisphaerales bacterium JB040]